MGGNKISELLNQPGSGSRPSPQPSSPAPPSGSIPPRPPSAGGGANEVEWEASRIRMLGAAFEAEVGEAFRKARNMLNVKPRDAQPAAFTTFGISCALVYTQLIEYADQDLINKTKDAKEINDRLHKVAGNAEEAERASTIKEI
jgi:hypothetical protein